MRVIIIKFYKYLGAYRSLNQMVFGKFLEQLVYTKKKAPYNSIYLTLLLSIALSVLAPKHIESYTPSLERESRDLVSRFIESTEKNGSVNPLKHLELFSMNVIITAIFSKRFDSVEDADFKKLDAMVAHVIKNCGLENDLPNFLPIVSIYHYFFGGQAEQRDFIKNKRNPFFRQLIRDAAVAEGPNVIKSLVEDGFKLSNDETLAITGMHKILLLV